MKPRRQYIEQKHQHKKIERVQHPAQNPGADRERPSLRLAVDPRLLSSN